VPPGCDCGDKVRILFVIFVLAAGLLVWLNQPKSINADELRIQLVELRSQAVQGELIAGLLERLGLKK
jgi:hypothetical protein